MERFVRFVTGGGIVLVAGLSTVAWFASGSPPWLLGVALTAVGSGALLYGIGSEIEGQHGGPSGGRERRRAVSRSPGSDPSPFHNPRALGLEDGDGPR